MKKLIAIACMCTALLGLTACGKQAPLLRQEVPTGTYVGVLEEKNDAVVVVRNEADEDSRLFWMTGGLTCDAEAGDTVTVSFTGDLNRENDVLTATEVSTEP